MTKFEQLIQGMITQQHAIIDGFLPSTVVEGLRNNLLAHKRAGDMHPAGVGKNFDYQRNTEIRGDVIKWLDNGSEETFEKLLMEQVQQFVQYLNQTCYTGINDFEFHYAYYEKGSFYKRHLDQFRADRGRKFSLVIYLNENWQESDGGQLSLYLEEGTKTVLPIAGRAVFFQSDVIEHEVHVAPEKARMSIAGWLKNI